MVIIATPSPTALTLPVASTVATDLLLLLYFKTPFFGRSSAAIILAESSTFKDNFSLLTVILVVCVVTNIFTVALQGWFTKIPEEVLAPLYFMVIRALPLRMALINPFPFTVTIEGLLLSYNNVPSKSKYFVFKIAPNSILSPKPIVIESFTLIEVGLAVTVTSTVASQGRYFSFPA